MGFKGFLFYAKKFVDIVNLNRLVDALWCLNMPF